MWLIHLQCKRDVFTELGHALVSTRHLTGVIAKRLALMFTYTFWVALANSATYSSGIDS